MDAKNPTLKFEQLITAARGWNSLRQFVHGSGLSVFVFFLAKIESRAAQSALEKAARLEHWERYVNMAIIHLTASLASSRRVADAKALVLLREAYFMYERSKCVYASCLLAICYKYLNRNQKMEQMLELANEYQYRYRNLGLDVVNEILYNAGMRHWPTVRKVMHLAFFAPVFILIVLNPATYLDRLRFGDWKWTSYLRLPQDKDLKVFCSYIRSI